MERPADDEFLKQVNANLGIAHKVIRIYFPFEGEDGRDAFQEIMYQLWRSFPTFDGRSKFSTWMYRVCLNTAITFKRRVIQNRKESLTLSHHQIADEKAETGYDVDPMFEAISKLSNLNKAIVLLYLEDHSYEEIAQVTGLTRSNVSVRLVRIKRELERMLKNI